jgi:surfactin synthase thioesterase subunit
MSSLQEIAEAAAREVEAMTPGPIALFGHSMGAVVAVEAARVLSSRGLEPVHLFVSGRRPPHVPDRDAPLRHLNDDDFVEAIGRRYAPIPAAIVEDRDLFALLLPTLRSDLAALETHPVRRGATLSCPIAAFGGAQDARTPQSDLDAWRDVTTGDFHTRVFPGDHFYLVPQRVAVCGEIAASLDRARRDTRAGAETS